MSKRTPQIIESSETSSDDSTYTSDEQSYDNENSSSESYTNIEDSSSESYTGSECSYSDASDFAVISDESSSTDSEISEHDIRQVCTVKIDKNYSHGKYGDFDVIIMDKNGYINATNLCKLGNKNFYDWKATKRAGKLIRALSLAIKIRAGDLMKVVTGGKNTEVRGTYVHSKLIPHIASWVSPNFAIKVSNIVEEYYVKKAVAAKDKLLQKKEDKIDKLLASQKKLSENFAKTEKKLAKDFAKTEKKLAEDFAKTEKKLIKKYDESQKHNEKLQEEMEFLVKNSKEIVGDTRTIRRKLGGACDDRVVSTGCESDDHVFYIAKYNDKPKFDKKGKLIPAYSYCVMRTKKASINTKIQSIRDEHPKMKIICNIERTPNSVNLWTRIRSNLKKRGKIDAKGCNFNLLGDFTEKKMLSFVENTHDERFDTSGL